MNKQSLIRFSSLPIVFASLLLVPTMVFAETFSYLCPQIIEYDKKTKIWSGKNFEGELFKSKTTASDGEALMLNKDLSSFNATSRTMSCSYIIDLGRSEHRDIWLTNSGFYQLCKDNKPCHKD